MSNKKYFLAAFALVLIYLFQLQYVFRKYDRLKSLINEDAFGYYVILPTYFKYSDPNYDYFDSTLKKKIPEFGFNINVINTIDNKKVCKYYSGVAILQSPFYFLASLINQNNQSNTGFESIYHYLILCSVIFYMIWAIVFFVLASKQLKIPPFYIFCIGTLALSGTNIYAYSTYDAAYSHIYSIFAFNALMYFTLLFKEKNNSLNWIALCFFAGIIITIRPLNGLFLFVIPIILGLKSFKTLFLNLKTYLFALFGLIVPSIQVYLWHWQTTKYYIYPYVNEYLNFKEPKIFELLFSYDCGWFVYTPIPFIVLILSIVFLVIKKKIKLAITSTLLIFSILYLISCWYYLHYGCTISCRPLTEYIFPILILFSYSSYQYFKFKFYKLSFFLISILGIFYNQIIHYQFYNHILNSCSMNESNFKMVFLKTHPYYAYSTYPFWDFNSFEKNKISNIEVNHTLICNNTNLESKISLQLPALITKDSSFLLDIELSIEMFDKINESTLNILINDDEQYVDLHHFLLKRVVKKVNQKTEFTYQILINKSVKQGIIYFYLNSLDKKAKSECQVKSINIQKIKF